MINDKHTSVSSSPYLSGRFVTRDFAEKSIEEEEEASRPGISSRRKEKQPAGTVHGSPLLVPSHHDLKAQLMAPLLVTELMLRRPIYLCQDPFLSKDFREAGDLRRGDECYPRNDQSARARVWSIVPLSALNRENTNTAVGRSKFLEDGVRRAQK